MQAWRIVVLAVVAATHAGLVIHLSLPPSYDPAPERRAALDRIELVEVSPPPPPPLLRPPRRAVLRPPPDAGPTVAPVRDVPAPPAAIEPDHGEPVSGEGARGGRTGEGPATFARPSSNGRPLRQPARARLPGRGEAIVEGFHVREAPSIEDRVLGVAAMLFGGGRPETCDDIRQRLIGATPGLARDMDVERLQRLCTD